MADNLLNRILKDSKTQDQIKKEQEKQTTLLGQIYSAQIKTLEIEKEILKQERDAAKREARAEKVKKGDSPMQQMLKSQEKEQKKGNNILSTIGKLLASLLSGKGLLKALGLGAGAFGLMKSLPGLLSALGNLPQMLGGALKGALTGLSSLGKGLISGGLSSLSKGLAGIFGKSGIISQLTKGLSGLSLGKLIKGGGIVAGLFAGVKEYFETGKFTEALFSGGGAAGGAIAGGALGSLLGPIGTAVGAALGAFIGEQLGDILKTQLDKVPFLQDVFARIDSVFEGFIQFQMGIMDSFKITFDKFMNMVDVLGGAFNRFNEESIQPTIAAIGDFIDTTWTNFTNAVESVTSFIGSVLDPILDKVGKFLKPVIEPLEKLATKIMDPLLSGFESLAKFLSNFDPRKAGQAVGGALTALPNAVFDGLSNFFTPKQMGGFVGTVPNMGGNGDRFPAMLQSGSVVLNQRAAGYQSGGMVPTMLEQGEQVYGPNDPNAGAALMMNSMIPRFQNGGIVSPVGPMGDPISQSQASGARTGPGSVSPTAGDVESEVMSSAASAGKTGSSAILAAAQQSAGIYAGVGEMCARTTREVLKVAGHPAAMKTTSTANLDSPKGYGPSKTNPDLAGSFAGTDMGKVYDDPRSSPPGSVIMWRGTYGVDKWGPEAVTHVGIRGEGGSMYHHGSTPGWRKDSISSYPPDFAVDLNGTASGGGISSAMQSSVAGPSGIGNFEALGSIFGEIGGAVSGVLKGIFGAFSDTIGGLFGIKGTGAVTGVQPGDDGSPGDGGGGAVSVNDPNAKALLNAIADAEGTSKYPNQGYNTMFTGKQFSGTTHPRQVQRSSGYASDAAGRYQFLSTTWGEYNGGNDDMSPSNQDQVALKLVSQKKGVNIKDGLSIKEIYRLGGEWASIEGGPDMVPGGSYGGQAKYSADKFMKMYQGYGGKVEGMQTGGVAQVRGSSGGSAMATKSQEQFAKTIAQQLTPIVMPIPVGGGDSGGGDQIIQQPGTQTQTPNLPAEDQSIVSMEYKYRITMGASV